MPLLAFVLLKEPVLPSSEAVALSYNQLAPDQAASVTGSESNRLSLDLGGGITVEAVMVPAPIPNNEAENAAEFSLGSLGTEWKLPPYGAHLIAAMTGQPDLATPEAMHHFTLALAALVDTASAVGVYWGEAGATHSAEFVLDVATDEVSRTMLWNGVSVANDGRKRLSLLSLGMQQLGLPNLMLTAPRKMGEDLLSIFCDLLKYCIDRGEPIPDGDTIGRTATEKWRVRYEPSPLDSNQQVWRIDVP